MKQYFLIFPISRILITGKKTRLKKKKRKKENLQKHPPEKKNIPRITNFKQLVISSNIILPYLRNR